MNAASTVLPAFFLHIQKTAGSTLVNIAKENYGVENVSSHGDYGLPPRKMSQINETIGIINSELKEKRFISGHFGFDFARELMKGRFSFTFLREPKSRIVSLYHFCRSRDPNEYELYNIANNLSFDEFLMEGIRSPEIKAFIWNNQTWQLAMGFGNRYKMTIDDYDPDSLLNMAIKNLHVFSFVGFTESFEMDRNFILNTINVPLPVTNIVVNPTVETRQLSQLTPKTLDLLCSLTELDSKLYEYAWNEFKLVN